MRRQNFLALILDSEVFPVVVCLLLNFFSMVHAYNTPPTLLLGAPPLALVVLLLRTALLLRTPLRTFLLRTDLLGLVKTVMVEGMVEGVKVGMMAEGMMEGMVEMMVEIMMEGGKAWR